MEKVKDGKGRKGLILKTLEGCCSLGHRRSRSTSMPKSSKSWQRSRSTLKHQVAPGGYFTVYVGSNKERFVIKLECLNHPLFKNLLDEAEMEYGFKSEGPLELPCNVDLFYQVLREIDQEMVASTRCAFAQVWLRQKFSWILASSVPLSLGHGPILSMIMISNMF